MTTTSDGTATIAQIADVVGRAADDSSFRQQLLSAPAATLEGAGVSIPSGYGVQVLENTTSLVHLVLPARPSGVSDADLKQTATSSSTASSVAEKLGALGQLVVATWTDSGLKSQLIQDPVAVLAERGISMAAGVTVKVVEAAANVAYLAIPPATMGN
jgi:hypothetical protein